MNLKTANRATSVEKLPAKILWRMACAWLALFGLAKSMQQVMPMTAHASEILPIQSSDASGSKGGSSSDKGSEDVHNQDSASQLLIRSVAYFKRLDKTNVRTLSQDFYASKMTFVDPLTTINGREKMIAYYEYMYKNVETIKFDFQNPTQMAARVILPWTMTLVHKRLGDDPVVVEGISDIEFREEEPGVFKVFKHRDYFDVGAMLYENIPGIGFVIKKIKKLASEH